MVLYSIKLFFLELYFLRCASEWQEYQTARQKVIEVMNEAEKKLSEFSVAKAASSHEAEEKLLTHKVRY